MRTLIDSHVFIWWVLDRPDLSDRCRDIVADPANEIIMSVASAYEIALKASRGRLTLPDAPDTYLRDRLHANAFVSLSVDLIHVLRAATLPHIHGDPIDRILIAQAQVESIPILTTDPAIARYDVETIW